KPRAAALHLFVKDGALYWSRKNDCLDVRRVESCTEEVDSNRDSRLRPADFTKIPLQLMRVALGTGDSSSILVVAGYPAKLLRHESRVCVIDTEDDRFLLPQPLFAELNPQVFGDHARSLR